MKIQEALKATHSVYVGVEARTVKRKDRHGKMWLLVTAKDRFFLVRPDHSAYKEVSQAFVDNWDDWYPQTSNEARRESAYMNSRRGLKFRNVIMGLVMGPLPAGRPTVPDSLPEDF